MTRVLALVDHSHLDVAIVETARTVADLVHARLDVVHVSPQLEHDPAVASPEVTPAVPETVRNEEVRSISGPVVSTLTGELGADGVVFAVMGSRDLVAGGHPLGHVTRSLIVASSVPIVIVPPSGRSLPGRELRLLVPLDGEAITSRAMAARLALAEWGEVTALHVIGAGSAPMCFTSIEDRSVFADEFAARHAGEMATPVEVRLGQAASEIVDAVHRLDIDAVVLCWHQQMAPGRSEVVRRLLIDGRVPLILLPI